MSIKQRIVEWWDWKVYWLAFGSIRRMAERNRGHAYLMRLFIDGWLEKHPLPENLKRATEDFYESLPKEKKP